MLERQNTVAQYIATQLVLYLCKETVQMPGTWVSKRWWHQEVLELMGARADSVATE